MRNNKIEIDKLVFWFDDIDKYFSMFSRNRSGRRSHRHLFFDNGSDILVVAHLDTVQTPLFHGRNKGKIYAAGLDDRLGAFTAMRTMEKFNVDVLLTDLEEKGMSTAKYHNVSDRYRFIIGLDRAGNDFVDYDVGSKSLRESFSLITNVKIGNGSYSDICKLRTSVACINLGLGHKDSHSYLSHFDPSDYTSQRDALYKFIMDSPKDVFHKKDGTRGVDVFAVPQYDASLIPYRRYDWKENRLVDVYDYKEFDYPTKRKVKGYNTDTPIVSRKRRKSKRVTSPIPETDINLSVQVNQDDFAESCVLCGKLIYPMLDSYYKDFHDYIVCGQCLDGMDYNAGMDF